MVAKSTSWLSMCACLCACAMGANAADYPSWLADFVEPKDSRYAMQPIVHDWPQDIDGMVEALKAYGCRGAVLNCPFANGFTTNPDNIATLSKIMDAMDAAGLKYWIYDEPGYPSGMAGGLTLKDHPEYEAKGFYMRRHPTYDEPKTVHFRLDDQSDKIVWAAKYPFATPEIHETFINYEAMTPVPFTKDACDCELKPHEILFVFCSKRAYEGSHCTHNVCSFRHYLNVMDPKAVRRFLDIAYEPIKAGIPNAFKRAEAVFTDEPSLQTAYARSYEMWPYALAPWVDGLFEKYEEMYGESIKPYLPLLFEGHYDSYPVRAKFYRLVGKLISEAWSGQIAAWCKENGGVFSGHYLLEENITSHVRCYGDYVSVLRRTGYPGIDALVCYPEDFDYNTVKYPQMAARKMGANGLMVEICPFANRDRFKQAPLENMTAVMGILYLGGVRVTNSYFQPNFSEWQNGRINRGGYTGQEDTKWFNRYVGRLGMMLDGLQNNCHTFIYYAIEEVQAKVRPEYTATGIAECSLDGDTRHLSRAVYEAGYDFHFADAEDITAAAEAASPSISGLAVRTVIVPAADLVDTKAMKALASLKEKGVEVLFMNRLPRFNTVAGVNQAELNAPFQPVSLQDILKTLASHADEFAISCTTATVLRGGYVTKDGKELQMLVNKSRSDGVVTCRHPSKTWAWLCSPSDGSVTRVELDKPLTVPAMRAVFLLFD